MTKNTYLIWSIGNRLSMKNRFFFINPVICLVFSWRSAGTYLLANLSWQMGHDGDLWLRNGVVYEYTGGFSTFRRRNDDVRQLCQAFMITSKTDERIWWGVKNARYDSITGLDKMWSTEKVIRYPKFIAVSRRRDCVRETRSEISHESIHKTKFDANC